MKTIVSPAEDCIRAAAERLLALLDRKRNAVLALDASDDVLRVLRRAAALAAERGLSLREARVFAVCEFEGTGAQDPRSAARRLTEAFFAGTDADGEKLSVPDADDPSAFDAQLEDAGGIDLALLSLGVNARVGFNEPATPYDSNTHVQRLTDRTKRELAPLFGGEEKVPPRGVTMGFRQLCFARDILVIALGEEKSAAVFHMLYGRDDSVWPAAFLQLPANVTVLADGAAAAKLGEKSFDAVKFNGD
ncbi:MAG: 6-phosphogluconolactonase [Oscillospiraceae bacterium]|nr:6-phosphogluconolactonase [Oscillospiraceae bacterium]